MKPLASLVVVSALVFVPGMGCQSTESAATAAASGTSSGSSGEGAGTTASGSGAGGAAAATSAENAAVTTSASSGGTSGGVGGSAGATGDGNAGGMAGAAGDGGTSCSMEDTWRPSARFAVVDPVDFGAAPDGASDATPALEAAVDALPDTGGIVLFRAGTYLKPGQLWRIQKDHVLLWAPGGRATLHGTVREQTQEERDDPSFCGPREQATIFERTQGGGVHGLKFSSNATERLSCAETNQIVLDGVQGAEIVGVEISGASATGIFAWRSDSDGPPSSDLFIVGNHIHHTQADSIHHTSGTRRSWVWDNVIYNEAPSLGDDGVACVTYGVDSPRCGEMEWWNNRYLGGAHGRGMAVIGGEDIAIHHNWIIGSASAGLIVASESAYDTASSERIELSDNWLVNSPNGSVDNGHAGILVSGNYEEAPPIADVEAVDNVIVDPAGGRVERAEGNYEDVLFDNSTDAELLPGPLPELGSAKPRASNVLRTWDTSFAPAPERRGLYRIHLRESATGALEERFEYVVTGTVSEVETWLDQFDDGSCSKRLIEVRVHDEQSYALVLSAVPLELPGPLSGVPFELLRAGDRDGTLAWLWQRLDGSSD